MIKYRKQNVVGYVVKVEFFFKFWIKQVDGNFLQSYLGSSMFLENVIGTARATTQLCSASMYKLGYYCVQNVFKTFYKFYKFYKVYKCVNVNYCWNLQRSSDSEMFFLMSQSYTATDQKFWETKERISNEIRGCAFFLLEHTPYEIENRLG